METVLTLLQVFVAVILGWSPFLDDGLQGTLLLPGPAFPGDGGDQDVGGDLSLHIAELGHRRDVVIGIRRGLGDHRRIRRGRLRSGTGRSAGFRGDPRLDEGVGIGRRGAEAAQDPFLAFFELEAVDLRGEGEQTWLGDHAGDQGDTKHEADFFDLVFVELRIDQDANLLPDAGHRDHLVTQRQFLREDRHQRPGVIHGQLGQLDRGQIGGLDEDADQILLPDQAQLQQRRVKGSSVDDLVLEGLIQFANGNQSQFHQNGRKFAGHRVSGITNTGKTWLRPTAVPEVSLSLERISI